MTRGEPRADKDTPPASGPGLVAAVLEAFPALQALEGPERALLAEGLGRVVVPAGQEVFQAGGRCPAFVLVLEGSIKVSKISENGREIVLYRVERGQTCVLTTACLILGSTYDAEGVTENPVLAAALPAGSFARLIEMSSTFRRFVFSAYAVRLTDLLMLVEEVAFGRIDERMAQALLTLSQGGQWNGTHQDLAFELGTAREVVSRQLKEFERRGWVTLARGCVTVRMPEALAALRRQGS
ncbi:Crp/Fnr family transcriptional regulator [Pararhodospirillum oryzae]|uniref:Crp/Fnr family transcriptional regulator n=1 Tax=Pararhodospirillum oryzae TaxID=478448 RepID=A0A512H977_9PROT|nr:Crp/Fnr family transcriptional regulator [Pararhodospirillum oryzae]GEO81994.1 Crp/Fnr family transcriptional regulator [Pararhodospirillum oryzae]